ALAAGTYTFWAVYAPTDTTDFSGAIAGPEPLQIAMTSPSLTTEASPNGTLMLGTTSVSLSDTATLSGAYLAAGGTIKFSLFFNGGSGTTYTDVHDYSTTVVANGTTTDANGDGTYSSDSYALPTTGTVAGSYYWSASYTPFTGDLNNNGASEDGSKDTNEQVTVTPSRPVINTTPSVNGTMTNTYQLGTSAPTLTDSAKVTGGYPTLAGSLPFSLAASTAGGLTFSAL